MSERTGPVTGEIVVVARFTSLPEADAARSALAAEGIDAFLADENTVGINWLYSNAIGGIRLQVLDSDVERAERVLRMADDAEPADEEATEEADVDLELERAAAVEPVLSCSECGSTDVARIPRAQIALVVAAVTVGVTVASGFFALPLLFAAIAGAILLFGPTHKCRDCSHAMRIEQLPAPPEGAEPPTDEAEPLDVACPRCGSPETEPIARRRMKGATLMMSVLGIFLWIPLILAWPFLPRQRCLACEKRF